MKREAREPAVLPRIRVATTKEGEKKKGEDSKIGITISLEKKMKQIQTQNGGA